MTSHQITAAAVQHQSMITCHQDKTVRPRYLDVPEAVLIKMTQKCCARSGWKCHQLCRLGRGRIEGGLYNIVASRAESRAFALKQLFQAGSAASTAANCVYSVQRSLHPFMTITFQIRLQAPA